jgi:hypothetical protein
MTWKAGKRICAIRANLCENGLKWADCTFEFSGQPFRLIQCAVPSTFFRNQHVRNLLLNEMNRGIYAGLQSRQLLGRIAARKISRLLTGEGIDCDDLGDLRPENGCVLLDFTKGEELVNETVATVPQLPRSW